VRESEREKEKKRKRERETESGQSQNVHTWHTHEIRSSGLGRGHGGRLTARDVLMSVQGTSNVHMFVFLFLRSQSHREKGGQ